MNNINFKVKREYEIIEDKRILICEYKYDNKGNKIYEKNKYGIEFYYKYDDHGNKIYGKDNYGIEYYYKFDDHNNMIYEKDSNGNEYHWEYKYDDKGNIIYKKYPSGGECYLEYEYDDKGNMIYMKSDRGYEWFCRFDDYGNKIYKKDCDGREWFYKYDNHNNLIYMKDSDGNEYKYDDHGNLIYRKDSNGIEYYYKYDDHGNLIYRKDSNGNEYHYEYDDISPETSMLSETFISNTFKCFVDEIFPHLSVDDIFDIVKGSSNYLIMCARYMTVLASLYNCFNENIIEPEDSHAIIKIITENCIDEDVTVPENKFDFDDISSYIKDNDIQYLRNVLDQMRVEDMLRLVFIDGCKWFIDEKTLSITVGLMILVHKCNNVDSLSTNIMTTDELIYSLKCASRFIGDNF